MLKKIKIFNIGIFYYLCKKNYKPNLNMLIKNINQNPQKAYLKCLNKSSIFNPHQKPEYGYWASGEVYKDKDGDFIFNLSVKDSIFLGVERKFILTIYEDKEKYVKVITEEQYKNKDYCFTC